MNEIIEKTRELGELIQNSEEMKNAKNAEILQENDDEAQALLKGIQLAENEPCTRYAKQQDFA